MPSTRKSVEQSNSTKTETSRRSKTSIAALPNYQVNDKILCLHQGSLFYEAKIIAERTSATTGEKEFQVHYQNWNKRYDEFIPISTAATRFKPYTEEAANEAKNAQREAAGGSKKKRTNPDVSVTPGTATSSRSSTPYDSSNKRIHARGSSTHDLNSSSAKRARRLNTGTPTGGQLNSTQSPKNIAPPPTVETPDLKAEYLRQFPDVFRQILKDDKKAFATGRLTVIPAKITVNEILNDYKESLQSFPENGRLHVEYNNGDSLSQTSPVLLSLAVDGLRDYFNCALRSSLLYKGEWSVYDDLKARESTLQDASNSSYLRVFNASAHYGVIHLIRLLSKLTTIHDAIGLSPEVCDAVEANIFDFSKFLEKKITDYYSLDDEYVTAAENGESSSG
ncbi:Mortality factor 4-like protein 1 isoform X2 [Aphelenchoides besseyi]|nr:Mortality factor 4-like protein 1 isoform X2 [Aphelenchoides besseyi]